MSTPGNWVSSSLLSEWRCHNERGAWVRSLNWNITTQRNSWTKCMLRKDLVSLVSALWIHVQCVCGAHSSYLWTFLLKLWARSLDLPAALCSSGSPKQSESCTKGTVRKSSGNIRLVLQALYHCLPVLCQHIRCVKCSTLQWSTARRWSLGDSCASVIYAVLI